MQHHQPTLPPVAPSGAAFSIPFGFGWPAPGPVRLQTKGTRHVAYGCTQDPDSAAGAPPSYLASICALPAFQQPAGIVKSHEELRWEDWQTGLRSQESAFPPPPACVAGPASAAGGSGAAAAGSAGGGGAQRQVRRSVSAGPSGSGAAAAAAAPAAPQFCAFAEPFGSGSSGGFRPPTPSASQQFGLSFCGGAGAAAVPGPNPLTANSFFPGSTASPPAAGFAAAAAGGLPLAGSAATATGAAAAVGAAQDPFRFGSQFGQAAAAAAAQPPFGAAPGPALLAFAGPGDTPLSSPTSAAAAGGAGLWAAQPHAPAAAAAAAAAFGGGTRFVHYERTRDLESLHSGPQYLVSMSALPRFQLSANVRSHEELRWEDCQAGIRSVRDAPVPVPVPAPAAGPVASGAAAAAGVPGGGDGGGGGGGPSSRPRPATAAARLSSPSSFRFGGGGAAAPRAPSASPPRRHVTFFLGGLVLEPSPTAATTPAAAAAAALPSPGAPAPAAPSTSATAAAAAPAAAVPAAAAAAAQAGNPFGAPAAAAAAGAGAGAAATASVGAPRGHTVTTGTRPSRPRSGSGNGAPLPPPPQQQQQQQQPAQPSTPLVSRSPSFSSDWLPPSPLAAAWAAAAAAGGGGGGGGASGSLATLYSRTLDPDNPGGSQPSYLVSISALPAFQPPPLGAVKSHEELRWEDRQAGVRSALSGRVQPAAAAAAAAGGSAAAAAAAVPDGGLDGQCCVCMERRAEYGFVHSSVMHLCLCEQCQEEMGRRGRLRHCLVCNGKALSVVKVVVT